MHRSRRESSHAIAGVFVFLLLGVFAVFSTMLVLFGAQAYKTTTERTAEHDADRTLYAYVLNSLRGDDADGNVELREENGINTLVVSYDYDGEILEKYVYCYDGYLRELLIPIVTTEFVPEMGEPVCEASEFQATISGSLVTIDLVGADGEPHTVETVLRTLR